MGTEWRNNSFCKTKIFIKLLKRSAITVQNDLKWLMLIFAPNLMVLWCYSFFGEIELMDQCMIRHQAIALSHYFHGWIKTRSRSNRRWMDRWRKSKVFVSSLWCTKLSIMKYQFGFASGINSRCEFPSLWPLCYWLLMMNLNSK